MKIRNIVHKGLKRFYENGDRKGLPANAIAKLQLMLTALEAMSDPEALKKFSWHAHQLTGDRHGTWSLEVTRNWRLTFRINEGEIADVHYEDYH